MQIEQALQKHRLLSQLSEAEIARLAEAAEVLHLAPNSVFIREGEQEKAIYMIERGSADISKRNAAGGESYTLAVLKEGSCVGEMSLLEGNERRTATARTLEPSVLIKIDFHKVALRGHEKDAIYIKLLSNIARDLSDKLNTTNQTTVESMRKELETSKARLAMGIFTVNLLFILGIYTLSFRILVDMVVNWGSNWISIGILVILSTVMYIFIKRSGYPLSVFGLTTANWRGVIGQAFLWTLPLLAGIALLKWIVLLLHPEIDDEVFSIIPILREGRVSSEFILMGTAYALFCPVQEFISRSGIQSALQNFLPDSSKRVWIAIVLSNLMFSMAHSHLNLTFALLTFVPGLYWGWMFAKQRSLLGASFSHVLVGVWIFFIVGIEGIWNTLF